MAKKLIDIKSTLGSPIPSFNVDAIEEMTRMIHTKRADNLPVEQKPASLPQQNIEEVVAQEKVNRASKVQPKEKKKTVAPETPAVESASPAKRGRKPNPPATDERMVRVSVDLPESVFIQLKIKVIQEKTDMKTWAWRLIERELKK